MSWKTLKRFLYHEGVRAKTPREVFKEGFRLGLLKEGDTFWSQMIEDHNRTSHTYDEAVAKELYLRLDKYLKAFEELRTLLRTKVSNSR